MGIPESKSPSRRALLAGALGGLGAWTASVIGRAAPAEAAAGDTIRMGRLNKAGGTSTELQTDSSGAAFLVKQSSGAPAIRGVATSGRAVVGVAGSNGTGVWGDSLDHIGVRATSNLGTGLEAHSGLGVGVVAASIKGYGLVGTSNDDVAIFGHSQESVGVYGLSNHTAGVSGLGDPGVQGYSATGYAGDFHGSLRVTTYQDIARSGEPPAPTHNAARLFACDDGSGKTQLCVRFRTGAVQVIATEP